MWENSGVSYDVLRCVPRVCAKVNLNGAERKRMAQYSAGVANSIYARRWLVNSAKMTPHSPSQQIIIFAEDKFSRRRLQITFPAPINFGNTSRKKKETPHQRGWWQRLCESKKDDRTHSAPWREQ